MMLANLSRTFFVLGILCIFFFGVGLHAVHALNLTYVSDLISTSQPAAAANHTIKFTATSDIPASGSIVLTPENGDFVIPASFDHTSVDIAVEVLGVYVDRGVAASADAVSDGVSAVSGSSGSITIDLSSSSGIASGELVKVELGLHAWHNASGTDQIINPTPVTSYKVDIATYDNVGVPVDQGQARIAIVPSVGVNAEIIALEPVRFNGLPSGLLPGGTQSVMISLETDIVSTCRYSETASTTYGAMVNTMSSMATGTIHYAVVTGLADSQTYAYYIRCEGYTSVQNITDYPITFSIGVVPSSGDEGVSEGSTIPTGGGGSASSPGTGGIFPTGGDYLPQAQVILDGRAYPSSKVSVLQDGELVDEFNATTDGSFNTLVRNLDRGTYTFGVYATDVNGIRSSVYTSTISIIADTGNLISQIYVPPTISVENDTLEPGALLVASGQGIPETPVELLIFRQSRDPIEVLRATSTTNIAGNWTADIEIEGLELGTYLVRARSVIPNVESVEYSSVVYIGIGGEPEPDFGLRADINKDGYVNLVDFSILLFYWDTDDYDADINLDGLVDITDFSIMVFYWTG